LLLGKVGLTYKSDFLNQKTNISKASKIIEKEG